MFDEIRPHLVELRKRLGLSVLALIVMFFIAYGFHEAILEWISAPLNDALRTVGKTSANAANGMMTTNQVGGAFFVALKVSFFAGAVGAFPVILYQLWAFVAPALYANEKKMILPFILGGTIMFAIGVLFAYYFVTPLGFTFLIEFGSFQFTPMINIEEYVDFFTRVMFGFGIAFELPIFAYTLALLGMINDRHMIEFFRYAVVIIFIVAAILTPPDVMTQILMAVPLMILYGISIFIVRAVNPAPKESEEEDFDDEDEIDADMRKLGR